VVAAELKGLKEGVKSSDEDEVLLFKGSVRSTNRAKANAFGEHYASVSNIKIPRTHRSTKKEISKAFRAMGPDREEGDTITLQEVHAARDDINGKKAAGPDNLHPKLLKNLPGSAV
jgi:hypothetical protein